jgi:hypothetical protein
MKGFIILLILILVIYYMKQDSVYTRAYKLGIGYLDNIDLKPNYAVMFDIDDTFINSTTYQPIKPIIKLMKYCNQQNILVLIITARDSIYTKDTIEELAINGIYSKHDNFYPSGKNPVFYDFLYLRKNPEDNHIMFKSNVKEQLAKQNGIITIMSIGDNDVDVNGKFSGYSIKLPNFQDPKLYHKDTYGHIVEVR